MYSTTFYHCLNVTAGGKKSLFHLRIDNKLEFNMIPKLIKVKTKCKIHSVQLFIFDIQFNGFLEYLLTWTASFCRSGSRGNSSNITCCITLSRPHDCLPSKSWSTLLILLIISVTMTWCLQLY